MIVHLEFALTSEVKVKILRTLFQEAYPTLDAGALSDETGKSRAGVHRAIKDLVATGVLDRSKRGRTTYYSVDRGHPWAEPLAELFRAERNQDNVPHLFPTYWNHLEDLASGLSRRDGVAYVLLHGSLTRSPVRPNADVDLLVAHDPSTDPPGHEGRLLGHEVSLVAMTTDRVRDKLKADDRFLRSVVERHVVLYRAPDAVLPWRGTSTR